MIPSNINHTQATNTGDPVKLFATIPDISGDGVRDVIMVDIPNDKSTLHTAMTPKLYSGHESSGGGLNPSTPFLTETHLEDVTYSGFVAQNLENTTPHDDDRAPEMGRMMTAIVVDKNTNMQRAVNVFIPQSDVNAIAADPDESYLYAHAEWGGIAYADQRLDNKPSSVNIKSTQDDTDTQ